MGSKGNTTNNNFSNNTGNVNIGNIGNGNNKTTNPYGLLNQEDISVLIDTLKLCTKLDERIGAKDKEDITQMFNSIKNLDIENPSDTVIIERKFKYIMDILENK